MLSIQKHKYNGLYRNLCGAVLGLGMLFSAPFAHASINADRSSAVVFLYQRIGEDSLPQSSISLEQFKEHIKELTTGGYAVLPLKTVIRALKEGATLPQKTVALTIEGAWISTLQNALPVLQEAELPFTLFISTDNADGTQPNHLDWKQLKALKRNKLVDLGIMPAAYTHMTDYGAQENAALINRAVTAYRENIGEEPLFFAYPYGEYSGEIRAQVANYPFMAGFAQQSGVMHAGSDFMALPRFIMTDIFGDIERFRLTANALPLPVTDVMPDNMVMDHNPPMIGFTVTPEIKDLDRLACFISGLGKISLVKPGGNRVEIRPGEPLMDRRTRINCTIPDDTIIPGQPQSWRWFGMQLVNPEFSDDVAESIQDGSPE
jgi:peptidoglycan/xylan/chitin deacetylase (PgdA/CDA1 family)